MEFSTTTTTRTLESLCARGVFASLAEQLMAEHSAERIAAWIEYADTQSGMGVGALVSGIRSGNLPPARPKSMLARQDEYLLGILRWLAKNFPEYDRPRWGPHPAAVAEVIRLHWRHGKGSLTKEQHGPAIHAAVEAWEKP